MQSESMISVTVQYQLQIQTQIQIQIQKQIQTKKLNSQTGVGDKYGDYWETPPPLPLLSRFFFCDDHGDNHDDHYHGDNHDDHDDNYDVLCDSRDNDHPGDDFHDN